MDVTRNGRSARLSAAHPEIYSIIGWHPTEAGSYTIEIEESLLAMLRTEKVIAMGEMGLDYYWMEDPKDCLLYTSPSPRD